MKKWVSRLMVLCLLLALPVMVVQAEDKKDQLEQKIIESCIYGEKIDVSEYYLSKERLGTLYDQLRCAGKLPWYATRQYTFYSNEEGKVVGFEPILLEESYDRMFYEQKVAEILNDCILEGMEDWQKALALHDYLALNCIYDEALVKRTGYDLLKDGTTVCSGYAELYQDLLLRVGIPCVQVSSDMMDHAWNLVQLDGQWYHVDVTWDDPTSDVYGRVTHRFFLKTDEEMWAGEEPHIGWATDIKCTDTRFKDAFWNDVNSSILFTDNNTCYYLRSKKSRNTLYSRNIAKGKETKIYQDKETYIDIGNGKYAYSHTGLTMRDGRLWLCTMEQVLSMKPNGKDKKTEYTYNIKKNKQYLAGCWIGGDTLYLTTSDADGNRASFEQSLSPSDAHRHSFVQSVTASTCSTPGYTTAVCSCGLTATGDPQKTSEHNWETLDHRSASMFSAGYTDRECTICGAQDRLVLEQKDFAESAKKIVIVIVVISVVGSCFGGRKKK